MADLAPDPRALAAKQRKEAAANLRWEVKVNDQRLEFRLSEMTAAEYGALKRGPKMSPAEAYVGAANGDLECFAAIWWLARRQNGESDLGWLETAASLSFSDEWYFDPDPDNPGKGEEQPAEEAAPDPQP